MSIEAIVLNEHGEKTGVVVYSKRRDYINQMAMDFIIHKRMEGQFLKYADEHPLMESLRGSLGKVIE